MSLFGKKHVIVRIEAQVLWLVTYDQDAKVYMGVCQALNLNAIGDTFIDFQECANEAMHALFSDLVRSGDFAGFLRTHGWQSTPLPERGEMPRFDIPYETRQVPELTAAFA